MYTRTLALLFLFTTALPLVALTSTEKQRKLIVHHAAGSVTGEPASARIEERSLAASMPYSMRHDEQLTVIVDDQNPLVFTYTWKGVTKSNTANYTAALTAVEAVRGLAAGFKRFETPQGTRAEEGQFPTVGAALDRAGVTNARLSQLADDLDHLTKWADQIPQLTSQSAGSKEAAQTVKNTVLGWNLTETATRAQRTITDFNNATRVLLTSLALGPAAPGTITPERSITSGGTTTPGSTGNTTDTSSGTTSTAPDTPQPTLAQAIAANEQTARELRQFATYVVALQQTDRVDELVTALTAFRDTASRINERLPLGTIEYSSTQDSTATFEIGAATGAKSEDVAKRPTGTFAFVISPYSPASIRSIAPAMIYSFVEAPEYGTRQLANGNYEIIREDSGDEVNGLTLGVMLELSPQSWNNPTVGGGFQLGISPVQDRLGVFAGGVLRLFDLFAIGGGIAYQQAEKLANGLNENQNDLTSADQLRTNTKFQAGPYLSITVKLD